MLSDCCITFLPVNRIDNRSKLTSLFSCCVPVVSNSFVLFLRNSVDRFLPDLIILDKQIRQKETDIASLIEKICLILDSELLKSIVVFFAVCDVSHRIFIIWQELRLLLSVLKIFAELKKLRIDFVVNCFCL